MPATAGLTAKQRDVLAMLRKYVRKNTHPPTYDEISAHFGWSSPNAAKNHIDALEAKGKLRRKAKMARSIVLT